VGNPASDSAACLDEHEILAFAMGELDGSARSRALVHVDGCESCRRLAAALAREASYESKVKAEEDDDSSDIGPISVLTKGELVDQRFRLVGSLGRGAMGTVYRAHDTKLDISVALKLLEKDGVERDEKAFARELKVGRRVTHPNVCRMHDAGKHEGHSYITMEIVEGETLADLLTREPMISEERALSILDGILSGLAAVHTEGIVHRDLKPANVMIERESGKAILTDFGFAADLESHQSRRLVGTPSFWAPEQARGETPTPASDVFSFGVLAYRLLVGKVFEFSDTNAIEAVPRPYRSFIATCVAPRPSERYPSAIVTLKALRDTQRRRPPIAALLLAAAAVVVLGGIGFVMTTRTSGATPDTSSSTPSSPTIATPSATMVETAPPLPPPTPPATTSAVASPPPVVAKSAPPTPKLTPSARPTVSAPPPATAAASSDPLYRH